MLKHDPNYRPLPVTGSSLLGKATYWLAPDHLLVVEIQAVVESYRRFELKDVQALELAPTVGSKVMNWIVCCLFAAASGVIAAALTTEFFDTNTLLFSFTPVALTLLGIFAYSLWAGPSCRFTLKTAVQSVVLPGISRRRKAERLWAELEAAITRAQVGQGIAPLPPVSDLAAKPATPESPAES